MLERHYVAGGFTHAFHRPGYEWDVGVHYVGQVQDPASPLRAIFDHLTGGRLKWNAMPEVYDRIRIGEREYEFVAGLERFRDRLKSYFPNETAAIDRYLQAVLSCAGKTSLYFAEKALPRPIARVAGAADARALPALGAAHHGGGARGDHQQPRTGRCPCGAMGRLRPAAGGKQFRRARHHCGALFRRRQFSRGRSTEHRRRHRAHSSSLPAARSSSAPRCSEILLDRAQRAVGVRMQDGREFRAGIVISDAGAWNTFASLLPPEAPGRCASSRRIRALSRLRWPTCASMRA